MGETKEAITKAAIQLPQVTDGAPCILHLRSVAKKKGSDAVNTQLQNLLRAGTPIVEELPEKDLFAVTFFYAPSEACPVGLSGPITEFQPWVYLLKPLEETNFLYLSLLLPKGAMGSYYFVENPGSEPRTKAEFLKFEGTKVCDTYASHFLKFSQEWQTACFSVREPLTLNGDTAVGKDSHLEQREVWSEAFQSKRKLTVRHPTEKPVNILIVFDAQMYLTVMGLPGMLSKLEISGKIKPTLALLLYHSSQENRRKELGASRHTADFVMKEMLPAIMNEFSLTRSEVTVAVTGSSLGGLMSCCCAHWYPEQIDSVIAQSPSVWWTQGDLKDDYVTTAKKEGLPEVFFAVDVGTLENRKYYSTNGPTLPSVREFAALLGDQKHSFTYAEFEGGHDYLCWRSLLPRHLVNAVR